MYKSPLLSSIFPAILSFLPFKVTLASSPLILNVEPDSTVIAESASIVPPVVVYLLLFRIPNSLPETFSLET